MKAPLFRDPIFDGAADPVVVWNREAQEWWMIYTNRRATAEGEKFAWVHGTDLGVASSRDGGSSWLYRGTLQGLDIEWGRNTFWARRFIGMTACTICTSAIYREYQLHGQAISAI